MMFGLGLPTHWIFLVKKDGTKENVSNTDCNTKQDVRDEVKDILNMSGYNKEKYIKAQYVAKDKQTVLYEFSINELED